MPIRYVGKQSLHRGKYLFELLRNLKDFGVGRMVARNTFERYPEPCYFVVREVRPEMDADGRFGQAFGAEVFRGRDLGVQPMENPHYADWKLIPKEMEDEYKNFVKPHIAKLQPPRIIPADMSLPPLMRIMHQEDALKSGKPLESDPRIPITIRRDAKTPRLQEGVEVPKGTPVDETPYQPLPESFVGRYWLSHRKPSS